MSDDEASYLDAFSAWLSSLGADAQVLAGLLTADDICQAAREHATGGLNYLFKSLDLIPDGIDEIGYLDDAFVLRVSAKMARDACSLGEAAGAVDRLADEAATVEAFLGDAHPRLLAYVDGLRGGAARGRTVDAILAEPATLSEFSSDVQGFVAAYQPPAFRHDVRNLIKLRAFFDAKLPK